MALMGREPVSEVQFGSVHHLPCEGNQSVMPLTALHAFPSLCGGNGICLAVGGKQLSRKVSASLETTVSALSA